MTCIVGYVEKGRVYMGADSCGSNGHNYAIYNRPKLFKINDRFIIGCTGTFRLIDLLHYGFDPPKITEGYDRNGYMGRDFIPALRKYFKDHGLLEKQPMELSNSQDRSWLGSTPTSTSSRMTFPSCQPRPTEASL